MTYSKQLNQTDCGPCALGNAIKFLGLGSGYKQNHSCFKLALGWLPNTGVSCYEMSNALKFLAGRLKFKQHRLLKPTWPKMRTALDTGYGLIMAYDFKPGDIMTGHFIFISKSGAGYIAWNDSLKDEYMSKLAHREIDGNKIRARLIRGGCVVWKVYNDQKR